MSNVDEILERRVERVLPSEKELKKILKKKKISVYLGIDPTATRLHLGHTVPLRKLVDFANAGHEAILLFGTGTVLVGDPSERNTGRKLITQEEIDENIATWKDQVKNIVDFDKVKILQNGDWLTKLNLKDIINIASKISAVQLFKRRMFTRRIKAGDTVWYHETMYPLFQGYDSVVIDVDLEIGGTDQEFNMLVGRELQKKINNREKYVLETPMILGTDGKQMSKTSGNCVWLTDTPTDMFGKIMRIPDDQIVIYMKTVTNLPMNEIEKTEKGLKTGSIHPMDAKKTLAHAVVVQLHSNKEADDSQKEFEKTFQEGDPEYKIEILLQNNFAGTIAPYTLKGSISEAKRFIKQGSIEVNGKKLTNPTHELKVGDRVKIGTTTFGTIVK